MPSSIVQVKEHLLARCFPMETNNVVGPIALSPDLIPDLMLDLTLDLGADDSADCDRIDTALTDAFALECSVTAIKIGDRAGLLSRVSYYFPKDIFVSVKAALHYAEMLNYLLMHSRVFVIEDIDSDRGYFLQMDTALEGRYERENISGFLDNVTEDVAVLVTYFQNHLKRPSSPVSILRARSLNTHLRQSA